MKNGIDLSYCQPIVEWDKLKTDFVYIKMNTGINMLDKMAKSHAQNAYDRKIPLGYYHFGTLNSHNIVADAMAEAAEFISLLAKFPPYTGMFYKDTPPWGVPMYPVLDLEENQKLKLSKEEVELWITTFRKQMLKAGHITMMYSYGYWLNENLPATHKLGDMPLWLANYGKLKTKPQPPIGWKDVFIWQYTGSGRIVGVPPKLPIQTGDVDLNIMYI